MSKKIKITLIKSIIGRLPKHRTIAKQMGLNKINRTVIHQDTPSIRGMLDVISYLVHVEECSE